MTKHGAEIAPQVSGKGLFHRYRRAVALHFIRAIHDVASCAFHRRAQRGDGLARQAVVAIDHHHGFARGGVQCGDARLRQTAILLVSEHAHLRTAMRILGQHAFKHAHTGIGRGIVHEDVFHVLVRLLHERRRTTLNETLHAIHWHKYRHFH